MTSQTKDLKIFWGDYTSGEQPHIWFHKLEGIFNKTTTVEAKIYKFSKFLDPGRKAETWFNALTVNEKSNWDAFYVLFTKCWPKPIIIEPTCDDLMATLLSIRLEEHELGTLIGNEDEKAYAHIAWATEVRGIVEVLDDAQGYLIPQVVCNYPSQSASHYRTSQHQSHGMRSSSPSYRSLATASVTSKSPLCEPSRRHRHQQPP
jgi:hypothetical protein